MTSTQIGGQGVHKYHRWLERAFETNMPYDQFARELLSASGSTLDNPTANFYRTATDTQDCVETISQIFLGARLQCAKCHNHPFERWTQDNYYGMAAFFNRVQRKKSPRADELFIYLATSGEVTQPRTGKQMKPWLPGQGEIDPPAGADRRDPFVELADAARTIRSSPRSRSTASGARSSAAASSIRSTISAIRIRPATPPCSTPWPRTLPSTASTASTSCGRSSTAAPTRPTSARTTSTRTT